MYLFYLLLACRSVSFTGRLKVHMEEAVAA